MTPRHRDPAPQPRPAIFAWLVILLLRGVLLWAVVPLAAVAWPVVWVRARRTGVGFGQYLGWADLNLIAVLQRLLRPIAGSLVPFTSAREMNQVSHRLRWADPV